MPHYAAFDVSNSQTAIHVVDDPALRSCDREPSTASAARTADPGHRAAPRKQVVARRPVPGPALALTFGRR
jgi:hypothetical protein